MLAARGTLARTIEPIGVVLTGHAPRGAGAKLPKRKPRVFLATGVEPTFDEASSRKMDTRVIVVDADEFGLGLIRDLHTVFPSVKIVALSSSPRMLARAMKAGAVVALPRSTPPATLARVIRRLLGPVKTVKPARARKGETSHTKN
jgi:DNA-binding NarL/FixJ family response regulator